MRVDKRGQQLSENPANTASELPVVVVVAGNRATAQGLLHEDRGKLFRVLSAGSADEALDLARQHRTDVVIADMELSGIPIRKLVDDIRRVNADTLVVLLTGQTGYSSPAEAVAAGANAFLADPFESSDLVLLLKNLLSSEQLGRDGLRLRRYPYNSSGRDPCGGSRRT